MRRAARPEDDVAERYGNGLGDAKTEMALVARANLLVIGRKERAADHRVFPERELGHRRGAVLLEARPVFGQTARVRQRLFPPPYLRLPENFQVPRPAVDGNLAAIARRGAIVPGKLGAGGLGDQLPIVGDAVNLRAVVDAETVFMDVPRRYAEGAPVDLLDDVRLGGDRHLGLAKAGDVVGDLSRRQRGEDPLALARAADALVVDLDGGIA